MLFHTHEFMLLLLVAALGFRFLPSARATTLLAASVAFYAYSGFEMLLLLAGVVAFNYACYRRIGRGRGRGVLLLAIAVDLANLFTFKYTLFFLGILGQLGLDVSTPSGWVAANVVLPVGISFYTFQMIALLVDVYRGTAPPIHSFREFMLFVTFFGQLIAGPIMRASEFLPQLRNFPGPTRQQLAQGIALFGIGLVKKVAISDVLLTPRSDALWQQAVQWDAPTSWLLALLFGFQIYFDFSGYCDMAIGLGRIFGLELKINFATPYVSRTPSEFWSRWNITLSRWFGDYVYIPLGGSRVPLPRTVVNVLITMLVSGLWHGAGFNFVMWGALHGVALAAYHVIRRVRARPAAEERPRRVMSWLGWASTFAVSTVAWVYFRADSVQQANAVVANLFGLGSGRESAPLLVPYTVCGLLLAAHFLERQFWDRFDELTDKSIELWMRLPGPVQAMLVFPLLLVIVGVTKRVQGAFIYFQF